MFGLNEFRVRKMPNKRGTILIETRDVLDGVGKQLWSSFLLPSA
jgi:hypothetical protein